MNKSFMSSTFLSDPLSNILALTLISHFIALISMILPWYSRWTTPPSLENLNHKAEVRNVLIKILWKPRTWLSSLQMLLKELRLVCFYDDSILLLKWIRSNWKCLFLDICEATHWKFETLLRNDKALNSWFEETFRA